MAEVSKNTKYVKLDDSVSFELVRTNPKLTTNTKLMYNGKKMYMESYTSSSLMNRVEYKNFSIRKNSTYNIDIASFLSGSGSQAYNVYQNFSDYVISDSYDNQFETTYWCGAEYIDSSFYSEEIGFIAPLYLREKLPNYFLIFRLDTPSNYNFTVDIDGKKIDSTFDFKTDILDKAVLIKTFDLREGSVLGNYIHNYINQEDFEFDKSMYVNFSNKEVTYYGINRLDGVFVKKVENFENELLKNDMPILSSDEWFTKGFERNNLIFPYIMNIEYLFDDDNFKNGNSESYDFARYIGLYCNNIEFGEFSDPNELIETEDNAIYYFEDNKNNLHRYIKKIKTNDGGGSDSDDSDNIDDATEYEVIIDGKDIESFDKSLISGFEKERVTGYAEPLDIYEGFINRAQYGFEILKPFEIGDWVGFEYKEIDTDGNIIKHVVERYFADENIDAAKQYDNFRFYSIKNSKVNDIAEALAKCVNNNKNSMFEARYSGNVVAFYSKKEGKKYNGSKDGGSKILLEASLIYNRKISLPLSKDIQLVNANSSDIKKLDEYGYLYSDYYIDYFCGACDLDINFLTDTYKNIFKIYKEEYLFFDIDRYLKTNNGKGRRICTNMVYIDTEGKINPEYRLVVIDDVPIEERGNIGYDVSVSSIYQVEIMDPFKPNYGVLSLFPVKDFDFDINYSSYGQYVAFLDECKTLDKKITYTETEKPDGKTEEKTEETTEEKTEENIFSEIKIKNNETKLLKQIKDLAKSPFFDEFGNSLETEYDYYLEQFYPGLCLNSKTTPYISKWGYYDEQKDSCENPYRLNVSKIFGVSNLSANTYLRICDENEYTHNMPYYIVLHDIDYSKDYQYIKSDKEYIDNFYSELNSEYNLYSESDSETIKIFSDCVDYWINVFMRTDEDMFYKYFVDKKYGKRFDRKYSRLLCGDKLNNPSTLFRGVKFEAVRLYNGIEKRSGEYNDYKFSFVYIPVMINSMFFDSTVYFVKNDTFKFIVGIVFVNTMIGVYNHNIFNGKVDYFGKGFLYSACKDIIRPQKIGDNKYNFTLELENKESIDINDVKNNFWKEKYKNPSETYYFYMWIDDISEYVIVTDPSIKDTSNIKINNIIGEFKLKLIDNKIVNISDICEEIKSINDKNNSIYIYTGVNKVNVNDGEFNLSYSRYYGEGDKDNDVNNDYDITVFGYKTFRYFGKITCNITSSDIKFEGNYFIDMCNNEWKYKDDKDLVGYEVDVSKLYFKSESIQNILINMGKVDSIKSIKIYSDIYDTSNRLSFDENNSEIKVNIKSGNIEEIKPKNNSSTVISSSNGNIKNLKIDIIIKDNYDINYDSLGMKNYFSVFEQLSMYNICSSINNNYNVKYYSTVEDNKYKIRVIDPDSIEIEDKYEVVPLKITNNNVIDTVDIRLKNDVYKIGKKVINRYSGFYNPIFNNILYYDDYSKNIGGKDIKLPYSNTYIDYNYNDIYGEFGVIKNMYFHKTNTNNSNKILSLEKPIYPAINEYALDYRDYNIFSSSWDDGYFISQDDLYNKSVCEGIGSMKEGLCMFGSKYLNLPDYIFIDTFENGNLLDGKVLMNNINDTDSEIAYREINDNTVVYNLFIEKRLKRYLKEHLLEVFSKYINKEYSFGNKGTIEDDVDEYIEKNLLKLYKVEKIHMYIKSDRMSIANRKIENEYLKYVGNNNEYKIKNGFPVISINGCEKLKDSNFTMSKINEFDRTITYNLKPGFKESFGFGVSIRRK